MRNIYQSLLILAACLITFSSFGQKKYGIVKLHAFVQEGVGGNIPVDENGNPTASGIHVNHFLFAETTGKTLAKFDTVYIKNEVYKVQAEEIKAGKKNIGKLHNLGRSTIITAQKGNRLWQLVLWKVEGVKPVKLKALIKKNAMVVTGRYRTTKFTLPVAKALQLETVFLQ